MISTISYGHTARQTDFEWTDRLNVSVTYMLYKFIKPMRC